MIQHLVRKCRACSNIIKIEYDTDAEKIIRIEGGQPSQIWYDSTGWIDSKKTIICTGKVLNKVLSYIAPYKICYTAMLVRTFKEFVL